MERWDIYDGNRIPTGRTAGRGDKLGEGEYHIVIHVCIFNEAGRMLIQQRQPFKKGFSNLWDVTVGGAVHAGEDSRKAAERELFEEIGYRADLSGVRPHFTLNFERGFDDFYFIHDEPDTAELKLQYEEVQAVKWASMDEILGMLRQGTFVPYYDNLIKLIFEMRRGLGAHL